MINAKAILFDLDGTLVDSTRCIEKVWKDWGLANNLDLSELMFFIHGTTAKHVISKFTPNLNLIEEYQKLLEIELSKVNETKLIPGVINILKSLEKANWGIVTSSPHELALAKLREHNIPIPEVLITADDVLNGKPHPEPFLLAANKLNIAADECLVFEDSNAGIQSAFDANMQIIQIMYGGHTELNPYITSSIKDYKEIDFFIRPNNIIDIRRL